MRNGRGKRNGFLRRMMCRVERGLLGLGMRGVASIADRQMGRYHAREAAAGAEPAQSDA